ncbi:MAG: MarR family transcriptional regulator [Cytophagaceae bacterium]|nr:MarR family transcriptional regulator [Cytophagaceae bacterium]MBK9935161.1 MarR family transcriptional regulator [Cytophagaceae bacterium]MBL0301605.1 MarR family transcriptional regulator [Cytophagaceae bacterium]MBL0324429.1 MarR family transcriptional regulator [Cytophagaceae bacterium]
MNFYQKLGPLVFGSRLRRLSEGFLSEVNKVYADLGIDFEASWFGVFYLLDKNGELSIHEISEVLEISHSAVSQMVKTLNENNLVALSPSKHDARKKIVVLTDSGKELLNQIKPVWEALEKTITEMTVGMEIFEHLMKIENDFLKKSLSQRIKNQMNV